MFIKKKEYDSIRVKRNIKQLIRDLILQKNL